MKLIEFPEQTMVIAKNQPPYLPFPAYVDPQDPEGPVIGCWRLSLRERLKVLFTGRIWHCILTYRQPLQPQSLQTDRPFVS